MKMSKELQSKLQSISKEEIEKAYLEYYSKPIKDPLMRWHHKNIEELKQAAEFGEANKVLDLSIESWEMLLKYFDQEDTMESYKYGTLLSHADCTSFFLTEIIQAHKDLPYYIAMLDLKMGDIKDRVFIQKIISILKGIKTNTIKDLTEKTKSCIKKSYKEWCTKYDFPETYERLFKENLY